MQLTADGQGSQPNQDHLLEVFLEEDYAVWDDELRRELMYYKKYKEPQQRTTTK